MALNELERELADQVKRLEKTNGEIEKELSSIKKAKGECELIKSQTSEIAGLDDVAGAMGLLSKVYGVHDLDIPFNDGIDVKHGYGPVSFSRLSEATDNNKSGIQTTYAVDEPVITSSGIACFGELTNTLDSSENKNSDLPIVQGGQTANLVSWLGNANAVEITNATTSAQSWYQVCGNPSITIGETYTLKFRSSKDLTGYDANIGGSSSAITSVDSGLGYYENHIVVTARNTDAKPHTYAAVEGCIYDKWMVIKGNVPNAPYIPTDGAAVTRKPDNIRIQQVGNMPAPGQPFYIVVDTDRIPSDGTHALVTGIYANDAAIRIIGGALQTSFYNSGGSREFFASDVLPDGPTRVIVAFNNNGLSFYGNGVPYGSGLMTSFSKVFLSTNDLKLGVFVSGASAYPLNSYIKKFKIKHGVMTDDLAKAYGKWGD